LRLLAFALLSFGLLCFPLARALAGQNVGTEEGSLSTVLTDQELEQLPSLGRNYGELLTLAPGDGGVLAIGAGSTALINLTPGSLFDGIVLQKDDPVPGMTEKDFIEEISIATAPNASDLAAVRFDYNMSDGVPHQAIGLYNVTSGSWSIAVTSDSLAPGSSLNYGIPLEPLTINKDLFLFTTGSRNYFSTDTGQPTLYSQLNGASGSTRVIGVGDSTPGGTVLEFDDVQVNASDELLIAAKLLQSGVTQSAIFYGNSTLLQILVETGSTYPNIGAVTKIGKFFQNDSNVVAGEMNGSIYSYAAGGFTNLTPTFTVVIGGSTGVAPGPYKLYGLDNNSFFCFSTPIADNSLTDWALFRTPIGGSFDPFFYDFQPVPGISGATFSKFIDAVSLSRNGNLSFRNKLNFADGSIYGVFSANETSGPVALAYDDLPTSLKFGGTYSLANTCRTFTLLSGDRYFESNILNGSTYYALIHAAPSITGTGFNLSSVLSTMDSLPTNARRSIGRDPMIRGHYFAFEAFRNGGAHTWFVRNRTSGTTYKALGEGDFNSSLNGPISRIRSFGLNIGGNYAFRADYVDGAPGSQSILTGSNGGSLSVVANTGAAAPAGGTYSSFDNFKINDKFQIGYTWRSSNFTSGVNFFDPAVTPATTTILTSGQTVGGFAINSINPGTFALNALGHMSFVANFKTPTGMGNGLFVSNATGVNLALGTGSALGSGIVIKVLGTPSFNNYDWSAALVSMSTASGTSGAVASITAGTPTIVAQDGGSSGIGAFSFGSDDLSGNYVATSTVKIDNRWNIDFNAKLSGGSIPSAYFCTAPGGTPQSCAGSGQPLAGGLGQLFLIPPTNGATPYFSLESNRTSRLVILNEYIGNSSSLPYGLVSDVVPGLSAIYPIVTPGTVVPDTGNGTVAGIGIPNLDPYSQAAAIWVQDSQATGPAHEAVVLSPPPTAGHSPSW